jgi:hypothetical protein
MSETHKRQGGPIKDYIVPVQPNTPSNEENQRVKSRSARLHDPALCSQPAGHGCFLHRQREVLPSRSTQHQVPNIAAIDTTEKQVVDLLNHAVNTMHMSRYQ